MWLKVKPNLKITAVQMYPRRLSVTNKHLKFH